MTDYNSYRESKGLSNRDIIHAIRSEFSNYSKAQQSMVCNPAKNGVCLLPEAEKILVNTFGAGPGLSISKNKPVKRRNHSNKNKPRRLCLRLSNSMYAEVEALMQKMCFATMQDLLEAAVQQMIERYGA